MRDVRDRAASGWRAGDCAGPLLRLGQSRRVRSSRRPSEFRIDRHPNRHLGFGIGEHFCLGANLARRSQRALLQELAQRMEWAELAGEPEQIHSAFVVGLKKLPVRYRIKRAA